MAQLKRECSLNVLLLVLREGIIKQLCLGKVFPELCSIHPQFQSHNPGRVLLVRVCFLLVRRGGDGFEAIWPVVDLAFMDAVVERSVSIKVHDGADGTVDGELFPVDSQTGDLGVEVAEVSTLQKRII